VLISEAYREMNESLHTLRPTYGASGHRWAERIAELDYTDILDYGCGKGTLGKALGFSIKEYDPAIKGKDSEPDPAALVVCTDVLEHIEPEHLDAVLAHIKSLTKERAFLVVATRPANKTLPDGRNAHLIIEPLSWWMRQIEKYFQIDWTETDSTQEGECLVVCR